MSKRRVVITGLGCITALAESAEGLFTAVCEGRSGISLIESFDTTEYPVKFGGEIKNFDATRYIDQRESKRMDRFTQFAVAAARQAVEDSGLDFSKEEPLPLRRNCRHRHRRHSGNRRAAHKASGKRASKGFAVSVFLN